MVDNYLSDFLKEDKIGSHDKYKSIYLKFEDFLGGRSATFYDIDANCLINYQHYYPLQQLGQVHLTNLYAP